MLKAKIHRATITETVLWYEGSITIDEDILLATGILENEKVQVVNLSNASRIETYVIKGERGSGKISLNGPAARMGYIGDEIIIIAYAIMTPEEGASYRPTVATLDKKNKITHIKK